MSKLNNPNITPALAYRLVLFICFFFFPSTAKGGFSEIAIAPSIMPIMLRKGKNPKIILATLKSKCFSGWLLFTARLFPQPAQKGALLSCLCPQYLQNVIIIYSFT
ncbi:MAG: hypothetical protein FWE60_02510 [Oscillospiraceae bacterium]|nr:hypothetical protein [Oscillospiraceae bacterium]